MNRKTRGKHEMVTGKGQFLVYQTKDEKLKLDFRLEGETGIGNFIGATKIIVAKTAL